MKSIIVYSQPWPSRRHQLLTKCTGGKGEAKLYVRAEVVEGDALHALDRAKPRAGETVLNSVEMP